MTTEKGDSTNRARTIIVFAVIVVLWIALDRWTKSLFDSVQVGQTVGSTLGGLIDFTLVHNTGAAWGIFAENTMALGIFSLVVVAALLAYFIWDAKNMNAFQTIGIALIVGGGIGNAIDRFTQTYVTDFIATTFIDFPVFNVADIGVTCGVVILMIGLLLSWSQTDKEGE